MSLPVPAAVSPLLLATFRAWLALGLFLSLSPLAAWQTGAGSLALWFTLIPLGCLLVLEHCRLCRWLVRRAILAPRRRAQAVFR